MSDATIDKSPDAASGFAEMMNQAAEQAGGESAEAPYGYTTDADGTRRPKKTAGRPRRSPSVDELKAEKSAQPPEETARPGDRAPDDKRRRGMRATRTGPKKPEPVVQFREGVIEKGINRLYRKAGKMIKVIDPAVGAAIIEATRKDDDDDITVGKAWEEVARTNPRIRRFLMKMISGGNWGQLFMAHAPILLAIIMKDAIRQHIPFMKLIEAFLDKDEDGEAPADGTPMEGLTMPDMGQMMAMAAQFAQMATRTGGGSPRPPEAPGAVVPVPPSPSPAGPGVTAAVPAVRGS